MHVLYTKRRRFDGELFLLYLTWYSLGRAVIEGLRTDSLMLGNIRISQLLAVLLVIVCASLWIYLRAKIHRQNDPNYMMLYVNTEEGQRVNAGTFYPKKPKKGEVAETVASQEPQEDLPAEQPQDESEEPQQEDDAETDDAAGVNEEQSGEPVEKNSDKEEKQ